MFRHPSLTPVVLLLVALVGSLSFADVKHAHFLEADVPVQHQLHSHDCGSAEVHKSLLPAFHGIPDCRTLSSSLLPCVTVNVPQGVRFVQQNNDDAAHTLEEYATNAQRAPPTLSV
jgi:hypothetical protein